MSIYMFYKDSMTMKWIKDIIAIKKKHYIQRRDEIKRKIYQKHIKTLMIIFSIYHKYIDKINL